MFLDNTNKKIWSFNERYDIYLLLRRAYARDAERTLWSVTGHPQEIIDAWLSIFIKETSCLIILINFSLLSRKMPTVTTGYLESCDVYLHVLFTFRGQKIDKKNRLL